MGLGKTLCVISLIIHDLLNRRAKGGAVVGDNERGKEKEANRSATESIEERMVVRADTDELSVDDEEEREDDKEKEKEKETEREIDTPDEDIVLVDEDHKDNNNSQHKDEEYDPNAEGQPTLIVCPLSVLSNWEIQLKQHIRPDFPISVYVYHGRNRSTDAAFLKKHDVVLTTYNILGNELNEHATADGEDEEKGTRNKKMDGSLYSNLFNAFAPAFTNFPLASPIAQSADPEQAAPPKADVPSALHQIRWLR